MKVYGACRGWKIAHRPSAVYLRFTSGSLLKSILDRGIESRSMIAVSIGFTVYSSRFGSADFSSRHLFDRGDGWSRIFQVRRNDCILVSLEFYETMYARILL